ncbi:hypothetical protein QLS91_12930 [Flavobacterium sp. LB2P84]|uniref:hypothetical protein n=1 Tax=Flavobacterium yafengii TaxID=3041253 RepID=UPI0024A85D7A|nr:hypothetical protein [Flavobacterium yafengii]MDI6033978.1 hypothetical protein [Flavobacterium yafengii]
MPTIEERLEVIEGFILLSKKGENLDNLPLTATGNHVLVFNPVTKRIEKIPNKLESFLKIGTFEGDADDIIDRINQIDNPVANIDLKGATDNGNQTDNPIELIHDDAYLSVENTAKNKGIKVFKDFFNFFSNGFTLNIQFPTLTRNSQQTFQDKSGTIALLEDLEDSLAPANIFKFVQKGLNNLDLENEEIGDIFCGWSNDGTERWPESEWLGGAWTNSDNFKPLLRVIID